MSDKTLRRQNLREATGPTCAEFATEGVTFLVGSLDYRHGLPETPWDRQLHLAAGRAGRVDTIPQLVGGMSVVGSLAFRHGLPKNPWDQQLDLATDYGASRVDALPQLVGAIGDLFKGHEATPETLAKRHYLQQVRAQNKVNRQANRTGAATAALLDWFEKNSGDVVADWVTGEGVWSVKSKGAGFVFKGDEFVVSAVQSKARALARDPRYHSYVSIVPTQEPEEFLVAFVIAPQFVPVTYEDALNIADTAVEDPSSVNVSSDDDEITVTPNAENASGMSIGSIFGKLFEPKKPEAIQKKIDRLTKELESLKADLATAQAAGFFGPQVGIMPYTNSWAWSPLALYTQMGSNPATESALGPVLLHKLRAMRDGWDDDADYLEEDDEGDDGESEAGAFLRATPSAASPSSSAGRHPHPKRRRRRMRRRARRAARHHRGGGGSSQPRVVVVHDGGGDQGGDDGYDDGYDDEESEGFVNVGNLDWDPGSGVVDVPAWNPTGANVNYPVGGLTSIGRVR